jgi:hypothetical protein
VVRLGRLQRNRLAEFKVSNVDTPCHARDYQRPVRPSNGMPRGFVATQGPDVMMAPKPSDKGEGSPRIAPTKGVTRMGKAALDLPDPLQAPPGEARTSADDLLAQLAGDEIDRLLAEAEAGEPKSTRAPFHVAPPPNPKDDVEPAVLPPAAAAPAPDPVPSPAEPEPAPPALDVAAEMDALFSAAVAKDEADAAEAVAAGAAEAEAETSAAERAGLATPAGLAPANVAAKPSPPAPATATEAANDDAPLPLLLRPLEWLNAPLAILPESVREAVGKIAIVTLLNAAAILAYVLVVKRMK